MTKTIVKIDEKKKKERMGRGRNGEVFGERTLLRLRRKGWWRNEKTDSGRRECGPRDGKEREAFLEFSICERVRGGALY